MRVAFSQAAAYADIRILEYAGIDPVNALDGVAGASGTAGTADSGPLTTTNANDLLFGANMTTGATSGPGTGFTSRTITIPDSDIAEDRIVDPTGSTEPRRRSPLATPGSCSWWLFGGLTQRHPTSHRPGQPERGGSEQRQNRSLLDRLHRQRRRDRLPHRALPRVELHELHADCRSARRRHHLQRHGPAAQHRVSLPGASQGRSRNLGPYSNVAGATTLPDSQPPTAPSALTATDAVAGEQSRFFLDRSQRQRRG